MIGPGDMYPALLINTSHRPRHSSVRSITALTCAGSRRSACTPITSIPSAPNCSTASSRVPGAFGSGRSFVLRPTSTRAAPARPNSSAATPTDAPGRAGHDGHRTVEVERFVRSVVHEVVTAASLLGGI